MGRTFPSRGQITTEPSSRLETNWKNPEMRNYKKKNERDSRMPPASSSTMVAGLAGKVLSLVRSLVKLQFQPLIKSGLRPGTDCSSEQNIN